MWEKKFWSPIILRRCTLAGFEFFWISLPALSRKCGSYGFTSPNLLSVFCSSCETRHPSAMSDLVSSKEVDTQGLSPLFYLLTEPNKFHALYSTHSTSVYENLWRGAKDSVNLSVNFKPNWLSNNFDDLKEMLRMKILWIGLGCLLHFALTSRKFSITISLRMNGMRKIEPTTFGFCNECDYSYPATRINITSNFPTFLNCAFNFSHFSFESWVT